MLGLLRRLTIPLGFLFDFWLGVLFAYCARDRVRADGVWAQPALSMVVMYAGIIITPVTAYFHLVHTDWTWLYLADSAHIPVVALLSVVALSVAVFIGGYYLGARLQRSDREKYAFGILGGVPLLSIVVMLMLRKRLFRYGSYQDFQDGLVLGLGDVKLGYLLVVILGIGVLVPGGVLCWELHRDGRRAASR